MATVIAHTLLGAGVIAGPARLLGAPRWVVNLCTAYGAVLGGLPDTGSWLVGTLGILSEFEAKEFLHHSAPGWLMYQPPYFLHVLMDSVFHRMADWWAQLWPIEVGMWVLGGALLWIAYRRRTT
jgi:membrane-bound metal-dependent hydrolase YbcI (DUF457 family)